MGSQLIHAKRRPISKNERHRLAGTRRQSSTLVLIQNQEVGRIEAQLKRGANHGYLEGGGCQQGRHTGVRGSHLNRVSPQGRRGSAKGLCLRLEHDARRQAADGIGQQLARIDIRERTCRQRPTRRLLQRQRLARDRGRQHRGVILIQDAHHHLANRDQTTVTHFNAQPVGLLRLEIDALAGAQGTAVEIE